MTLATFTRLSPLLTVLLLASCGTPKQSMNLTGDALWAAKALRGMPDTVGIVGYYSLLGMVLNTARTPLPQGVKPPLVPMPR